MCPDRVWRRIYRHIYWRICWIFCGTSVGLIGALIGALFGSYLSALAQRVESVYHEPPGYFRAVHPLHHHPTDMRSLSMKFDPAFGDAECHPKHGRRIAHLERSGAAVELQAMSGPKSPVTEPGSPVTEPPVIVPEPPVTDPEPSGVPEREPPEGDPPEGNPPRESPLIDPPVGDPPVDDRTRRSSSEQSRRCRTRVPRAFSAFIGGNHWATYRYVGSTTRAR